MQLSSNASRKRGSNYRGTSAIVCSGCSEWLALQRRPCISYSSGATCSLTRVSALPTAYYYTAGAAATAGFITCHALPADRAQPVGTILAPDLFPVAIGLDQTGNDACDSQGMICVSVSRSSIFDVEDNFFGYSTPSCTARVTREISCQRDHDTDFALRGVVLRRSPDADEGVRDLSRTDFFCLSSDQGRQGTYEFANCVKP